MGKRVNKRLVAIIAVVCAAVVAVVVPVVYFTTRGSDNDDDNANGTAGRTGFAPGRVDCLPEAARSPLVNVTKAECSRRGCSFDPNPGPHDVACYYPEEGGLRYTVMSTTQARGVASGGGAARHVTHVLSRSGPSPFGGDLTRPVLHVHRLSNSLLRITFDDAAASPPRYRVPLQLTDLEAAAGDPLYDVTVTSDVTLTVTVTRRDTGKAIWTAGGPGLVLSDQFLQLPTVAASSDVYGLGEHSRPTFRRSFARRYAWPAFARDQPTGGDENLYGVHPFYTCVEDEDGNTHGVFLLNSNAQEYELAPGNMVTWRTIGGVLDFFVFLGPSPESVVQQYTQVIGRPMLPPYWSLGFQLCRYGYNSLANLQAAVEGTRKYGIPQDVQYADIDHMDERKDFTLDSKHFAGLPQYFDMLRAEGMRTVIILDPCFITNETRYAPFERLMQVKGAVMWPQGAEIPPHSDIQGAMLGMVWPKGKVVFPDFFKDATQKVWRELIVEHHRNRIRFDGIWIDMNEPANFGTNLEKPWNWPVDARPYWSLKCGNNALDNPPYRPLAVHMFDDSGEWKGQKTPLADKTLCMQAVQGDRGQYRHYDVHSLYGWSQAEPTLRASQAATGERGLVIARSTFPGSGRYAGHWLGDNHSYWDHLRKSIVGILDFNLFGIPYIGADICGFMGDADAELCLRWMQLGAFYTFSRNHNGINQRDQHPGAFGDTVGVASREIVETRYWLLPFLYTLFYTAHRHGATVIRPVHHEFPSDQTLRGIDRQFMWGPALLISPILDKGQTKLTYYLPDGRWYDFFTGAMTPGPVHETRDVTLTSKPALHMRGGHAVVLQPPANNTHFSRQNPLHVRAYLDGAGKAQGELFWDDGVSQDTVESGNYTFVRYSVSKSRLEVAVERSVAAGPGYGEIVILGVSDVTSVTADRNSGGGSYSPAFTFNNTIQMLNITLDASIYKLTESFTISWHNLLLL